MGSPIQFLRTFPPAQQKELAAALRQFRRRVAQSLDSVTLAASTTTTMATLKCPAAELEPGSCMHFQIAGTITATGAGGNATFLLALNGTTIWSDLVAIASAVDTARSYLIDARIFWQLPGTVLLTGLIAIAPDTAPASVTGTGDLSAPGDETEAIVTPIYHTLSSQVLGRDQIITATFLSSAAALTGTTKAASLWVE